MDPLLLWIVGLTVAGGALGVLAAGVLLLLSDRTRERAMPALVSFAIGTLLGAAFLALLPHAIESGEVSAHGIAFTVLVALLGFFLLEKMVIWRHCHVYDCEVHGGGLPFDAGSHGNHNHLHNHNHSHGHNHVHNYTGNHANNHRELQVEQARTAAAGTLILVGDGIHNLVDGVLIAAAFLTDVHLGIVTAVAVITHEVPQELGDFAILLMSGYSRARALLYNVASSLTMVIGGVVAYFALSFAMSAIPYVLAIAAASFIYIAVADLIPGLHRRPEFSATVQQVTLIGVGVAIIFLADRVMH